MFRDETVSDRQYGFLLWGLFCLTVKLVDYVGQEVLPTLITPDNMLITFFLGFVIVFLAYVCAKVSHDWLLSALAVATGIIGYGAVVCGMGYFFPTPNLTTVLTLVSFFSLLMLLSNLRFPGALARDPIMMLVPWIFAVVIDQGGVYIEKGSFNLPGVWDLLVYSVLVLSLALRFHLAWKMPHTRDNAIDFSIEFLLDSFSVLFPKRRNNELSR